MIGTYCSVKFYLNERNCKDTESVPLYMRIIIKRKKAELFLNQYVNPKHWDDKKQKLIPKTKADAFINHHMSDIETKVNEIIWNLEEEKEAVTAKVVIQRLTGKNVKAKHTLLNFIDQFINEAKAKGELQSAVIAQYQTAGIHMKNYLQSTGRDDILLTQIKRAELDAFELFLLTYINDVTKRPMKRNTANKYLVRIKTVLINAVKKQLIAANPFDGLKIKNMKTDKAFLTIEEIEILEKHDLGKNESLIRVRDFFLFSVYTGLRFSDARALTSEQIKVGAKGRLWILSKQKKTGEAIEIPLLKQARNIYDKYEAHRLATGFVLPRLQNQKVNTYLREIMKLVGVKKDVHHHTARHTFATTILLESGVDIKVVSRMLGHYSLKSTEVYAKVTKELLENVATKIDLL